MNKPRITRMTRMLFRVIRGELGALLLVWGSFAYACRWRQSSKP
jgi:hypothetical protein